MTYWPTPNLAEQTSATTPRTLKAVITPHFNDALEADHLSIRLTLQTPRCIANASLLLFETYYGNVPAHPYTPDDIEASDAAGTLDLHFTKEDDRADQTWSVQRDTAGDISLKFTARPRKIDITTPVGPRVDLRRDQGGLIGCGRWFLPRPAVEDVLYRHVVQWDLSCAPGGTRAVWSFGEGAGAVSRIGGVAEMINSVFMVGPIVSYPDYEGKVAAAAPGATIYWFGSLPGNIRQLNAYSTKLFPRLAAFFRVPDSSYRVFIRKAIRGFGGGACLDSYVLEYDDSSWKEDEDSLIALLSHEMIHSFTMMGAEVANGYDNGWYIEGIAELYSAFLPYRFGLCGEEYLRERLNSILTTYGTSPRIKMDMLESQKEFFNDWYAELIPYARGCAYILQVDSCLRKITGTFEMEQNSPLDDIIVDMGLRWRRGEQLLAEDWLDYLRPYFGEPGASQELQDMLKGKVLDLSDVIVIHETWNLSPREQEILEFGFDRSSIEKRVISGVVPGSRAALAGLAEGDRVLSMSRAGICSKAFSASMDLVVERGGIRMHVSYWPRSFQKAKVWHLKGS
ncbi:peptidase M61 domain-containing protein [Aspergillus stella-maris]|uniref:peptidase M61 domain-containing protein n=1 Tax=Aspergillus stella-maris TaxID=1810926 RepID=UPI003CCDA314